MKPMKTYEIKVYQRMVTLAGERRTCGYVGIVTMKGHSGYGAVARAVYQGRIDPNEYGIGKVEEVVDD